jgi:peroxiredoxin
MTHRLALTCVCLTICYELLASRRRPAPQLLASYHLKQLLLALLLWPGLVAAQQPFAYTITGQLGPQAPTASVYLRQNGHVLDSARVRQGHFALRGTSPRPQSVQLLLVPEGVLPTSSRTTSQLPDDFRTLFLEAAPIVLTSPKGLRQGKLRAGPVNQDHQLFTSQWQALSDQLYGEWHPGDGVHIVTLSNYQRERPFYQRFVTKFIQEHPASWVSLDLLEQRRLGPAQYDQVAPLYAGLSPTLRASTAGRAYGQLVDSLRTVALGALAPDLTLMTPTGKRVSVRDYRGQYLLLLFWSSQCECGFELRPTQAVCRRYASRSWTVLNVSLDDALHRKQWLRALTDYEMAGTPASDLEGPRGHTAQRYHLDSPLQNFLLDPSGRILAVNLYGEELTAALAKYLPVADPKPKANVK